MTKGITIAIQTQATDAINFLRSYVIFCVYLILGYSESYYLSFGK